MQKREAVFMKTFLCAQTRSCFYEHTVVCTSGLIVFKRHTPYRYGCRFLAHSGDSQKNGLGGLTVGAPYGPPPIKKYLLRSTK